MRRTPGTRTAGLRPSSRRWLISVVVLVVVVLPTPMSSALTVDVVSGVAEEVTVGPTAHVTLALAPTDPGAEWVLLACHAQAVLLGANASYPGGGGDSVTARSSGFLAFALTGQALTASIDAPATTTAFAFGTSGTALDPIPGACCTTCARDFDPTVTVIYKNAIATVSFGSANVGYASGASPPTCKLDRRLVYELYEYILPDNSLSQSALFGALAKMSTAAGMRSHGKKVHSFVGTDIKRADVPSMVGRGIVYNILVKDTERGTQSAYAGGFTYSCDLDNGNSCDHLGNATTLALAIVAGGVGLLLVFFGHCLFRFQMYVSGVAVFSIAMYLVAGNTALSSDSFAVRVAVSGIVGLVGGIVPFLLWHFVVLAVGLLFEGFCMGFLFMCFLFSSPMGELRLWENPVNFGMTFSAGLALPAFFMVAYPRLTSIAFGAMCGSYAFIGALDYSVHSAFTNVVSAVIDRATIREYGVIYSGIQYQKNEYLMLAGWLVLLVGGALVQHYVTARHTRIPVRPTAPLRIRDTLREGVGRMRGRHEGAYYMSDEDENRPLLAPTDTIDRHNEHDDFSQSINYYYGAHDEF
eukprot:Opistho-2@67320